MITPLMHQPVGGQLNRRRRALAFPGAAGWGAYGITGGSGGPVVFVTNLNDDGAGSLRAALEDTSGPRIVVFETSGEINLSSDIQVTDECGITIAGETSEGAGVALTDRGLQFTNCSNIIIRHIRVRDVRNTGGTPAQGDCLDIRQSSGVAIDHCSFSWSGEENISIENGNSAPIIISNCLIAEAMEDANPAHMGGDHSCNIQLTRGASAVTVHHNLIMSGQRRNPHLTGSDLHGQDNPIFWVGHNYIYNCSGGANGTNRKFAHVDQGSRTYFKNNFFEYGPDSVNSIEPIVMDGSSVLDTQIYLEGNDSDQFDGDSDQSNLVLANGGYDGIQSSPLKQPGVLPTNTDEDDMKLYVLNVGALPHDPVDADFVADVWRGTGDSGGTGRSQGDAYDTPRTKSALTDTDNDGIPDDYEVEVNALSTADYTALENYLHLRHDERKAHPQDLSGLAFHVQSELIRTTDTNWIETSGAGKNVTMVDTPTPTADVIVDRNAWDFNGTSQNGTFTSVSLGTSGPASIFAVFVIDDLTNPVTLLGGSSATDYFRIASNGALQLRRNGGSNNNLTAASAFTTATAYALEVYWDSSGNFTVYRNGTDVTNGTPNDTGAVSFQSVGRHPGASPEWFNGKIAEIALWTADHESSRTTLADYAKWQFDIT